MGGNWQTDFKFALIFALDGEIRNEKVPQKLIDNSNNLKELNNVTRLGNAYIANLIQWNL